MDPFLARLAARLDAPLTLLARLLMATLFVMAGMSAGMDLRGFAARMAAEGLTAYAAGPVFWFLILSGLGLTLGAQTRLIALAMAGFSLISGLLDYADFAQPSDLVMLLKNIALTGGYLALALHGAGAWSLDGWAARRRARASASL